MNVAHTHRGFEIIWFREYGPGDPGNHCRLVQQSSIVGDYPDAFDRPGSSALWVGDRHHLTREQVAELIDHLTAWLHTGSLEIQDPNA